MWHQFLVLSVLTCICAMNPIAFGACVVSHVMARDGIQGELSQKRPFPESSASPSVISCSVAMCAMVCRQSQHTRRLLGVLPSAPLTSSLQRALMIPPSRQGFPCKGYRLLSSFCSYPAFCPHAQPCMAARPSY